MTRKPRASALMLSLGLTACSATPSRTQQRDESAPPSNTGENADDTGGDSTTIEAGVAFWSLDGELRVENGDPAIEPTGGDATLWTFGYWSADASLICTRVAFLHSAVATAAPTAGEPGAEGQDPVSEPVFAWWSTEWVEGSVPEPTSDAGARNDTDASDTEAGDTAENPSGGFACDIPVPATLDVGLGITDPRLTPAMERAGLDPAGAAYGIYLAREVGVVYVFGVAMVLADAVHPTDTTTGTLPQDGHYRFTTLQLLPYPP